MSCCVLVSHSSPLVSYMLLVRLNSVACAHKFYKQFNQRHYSALKPADLCSVEFVQSVHFRDEPSPSLLREMGSAASAAAACAEASRCPICQDGLYNGLGVVTTLCNHDFHSKCMLDSPDNSVCAVCRFSHEPCNPTKCTVCGSDDGLWMCTICGHAGCARNKGGHAEGHFLEYPDHHLAIDIETKQVWDYKADKWVCDQRFFPHELTGEGFASQEEADAAYARQIGGKSLEQVSLNSKLEAIGIEYNYVLVSSLESQKQ